MLITISDFYIFQANYSKAIPYLKAILGKNPYSEEIHRKLLHAYVYMEYYDSFKKHYKNISNVFKHELGVELSNINKELFKSSIQGKSEITIDNKEDEG